MAPRGKTSYKFLVCLIESNCAQFLPTPIESLKQRNAHAIYLSAVIACKQHLMLAINLQ